MIITIDGPSGTGKTTVAREVAKRLGFCCFDTGAMYRCVAWKSLKEKVDQDRIQDIEKMLGLPILGVIATIDDEKMEEAIARRNARKSTSRGEKFGA